MYNNLNSTVHPLSDIEIGQFLLNNKIEYNIISREDILTNNYKNYVVNLDEKTGHGTHWTAFIKYNDGVYIYFDSWGMNPPENIKKFIHYEVDKQNKKSDLFYTNTKLQDDKSIMCGYFVCHFLYIMNKTTTKPEEYINMFSNDTKKNDKFLMRFFQIHNKTIPKIYNNKMGAGFDLVHYLNKIPIELHMPGGYSFLGPNTNLEKRLHNYHDLKNADISNDEYLEKIHPNTAPIDKIDYHAMRHDVEYLAGEHHYKDDKHALLKHKHKADKRLMDGSFKTMKDSKEKIKTRILGGFVGSAMWIKQKIGFGNITDGDIDYFKRLMMKNKKKYPILYKRYLQLEL